MRARHYLPIFLVIFVVFYLGFYFVNFADSMFSPELSYRSSFDIYEHNKKTRPPRKGWFEEDGQRFFYSKGARQMGWQEIDDKWHFFDEDGQMKRGWLDAEDRFYLDLETGVRVEGTVDVKGKRYYLEPGTGKLFKSQWFEDGGKKIYLTDDGSAATGRFSTAEGDYYYDEDFGGVLIDLSKPLICLTYDDGPSDLTHELLDILDKEDVKASFFFQGIHVDGRKEEVKRIYDAGHSIGNHSYDHPNFTTLTGEEIISQLERTDKPIESITGKKVTWFRSPYGEADDFVLNLIGKPVIHWNVDSQDYYGSEAKEIKEEVLNYARDGAIVLMHDTYKATIEATKELIPKLKKEGYQIVNLDTLFKAKGVEAQKGIVYRGLEAQDE